jgi:hypothetical protein
MAAETGAAPRTTDFNFAHKVFELPGAVFVRQASGETVFNFQLGELTAAMTLGVLMREFAIDETSPDGELLRTVTAGLRHVREIRPHDSIPRELLDGTASWSLEERHLLCARQRVDRLIASAADGETDRLQPAEATDTEDEARLDAGLDRLALQLDLSRAQVGQCGAALARELAYIEALRERFRQIQYLPTALLQVGQLYRRDETRFQSVLRTLVLLKRPIGALALLFKRVDDETVDIARMMTQHPAVTALIRQTRDALHEGLMPWQHIPETWATLEIVRGDAVETHTAKLYQFVATNFPETVDWRSGGGR